MSAPIKCFMMYPTEAVERCLRRYYSPKEASTVCPNGKYKAFHNAKRFFDIVREKVERGDIPSKQQKETLDWPTKCDYCDFQFLPEHEWQIYSNRLWEGVNPAGLTITCILQEAPIGAMYNAYWSPKEWQGEDGQSLRVLLPPDGREWCIDSQASNCTNPDDHLHRCWVRHGTPPLITVDKNGNTCAAGAGSIQTPNWHGFLRNGELVEC